MSKKDKHIKTKEIIELSGKLPAFIKGSDIFTKLNKVKKIFPLIGLCNCETPYELDSRKEATISAKILRDDMIYYLGTLKANVEYGDYYKLQTKKDKEFLKVLKPTIKLLKENIKDIIKSSEDSVSLKFPKDLVIKDKKVFNKGESLFRVYNKIGEKSSRPGLSKLDNIVSFKTFSQNNITKKEYKIVFSSDKINGVWDLATISMRGITSCQTWHQEQSKSLVGTISDPFTGVIYLTDSLNHSTYGTKMLRRCLVRFVLSPKNIPIILVEHMYPDVHKSTMDAFVKFLQEKVGKKYDVVCSDTSNRGIHNYRIPSSDITDQLKDSEITYSDSDLNNNHGNIKIDLAEIDGVLDYTTINVLDTLKKYLPLLKCLTDKETVFAKSLFEPVEYNGKIISFNRPFRENIIFTIMKGGDENKFNQQQCIKDAIKILISSHPNCCDSYDIIRDQLYDNRYPVYNDYDDVDIISQFLPDKTQKTIINSLFNLAKMDLQKLSDSIDSSYDKIDIGIPKEFAKHLTLY